MNWINSGGFDVNSMIAIAAVVLLILGFIGRIAWTIGKWLIIIFIILAIIFLFLGIPLP